MEYSRPDYGDSSSEVERWIRYFRSYGLPAAAFYINRNKGSFRYVARLVYTDIPDMDEVRQNVEDIGVSQEFSEDTTLGIIDRGVKKWGYVVDVVWYISR